MPDTRLAKARDNYGGWIDNAILAKESGTEYLGGGIVKRIIDGVPRYRDISNQRDCRWLTEVPRVGL